LIVSTGSSALLRSPTNSRPERGLAVGGPDIPIIVLTIDDVALIAADTARSMC
jgi:hypothetical protein